MRWTSRSGNPTIEAPNERGVGVVPDGEGLALPTPTDGAGAIHCVTTPLGRG